MLDYRDNFDGRYNKKFQHNRQSDNYYRFSDERYETYHSSRSERCAYRDMHQVSCFSNYDYDGYRTSDHRNFNDNRYSATNSESDRSEYEYVESRPKSRRHYLLETPNEFNMLTNEIEKSFDSIDTDYYFQKRGRAVTGKRPWIQADNLEVWDDEYDKTHFDKRYKLNDPEYMSTLGSYLLDDYDVPYMDRDTNFNKEDGNKGYSNFSDSFFGVCTPKHKPSLLGDPMFPYKVPFDNYYCSTFSEDGTYFGQNSNNDIIDYCHQRVDVTKIKVDNSEVESPDYKNRPENDNSIHSCIMMPNLTQNNELSKIDKVDYNRQADVGEASSVDSSVLCDSLNPSATNSTNRFEGQIKTLANLITEPSQFHESSNERNISSNQNRGAIVKNGWRLFLIDVPLREIITPENIQLEKCHRDDPRVSHLF